MFRHNGMKHCVATIFLFISGTAQADFIIHSWQNLHEPERSFRLTPEFSYYTTKSNFTPGGSKASPFGFQGYSRIQSDFTGSYGFSRILTGYGRLGWGRAQVEHSTLSGSVFGLTDQTLGLNAHIWESKANPAARGTSIDLQLQVDFPAYGNANARANGTPFLGDNSTDITGGAFMSIPVAQDRRFSWLLHGGLGYTWRSQGFSSAIPWSAGVKILPREEGFTFSAGLAGFQSLRNDINTATVPAGGLSTTGAGGSYFINAVNPSLLSVQGQAGYQLANNLAFSAKVSQSLWGQAAANGLNAGIAMQVRLGRETRQSPVKQSPLDYGHANQGFVNYAFEARIVKTNDKLNAMKIDKGAQDGVEVGQIFDIFLIKPDGSVGEAIARSKCTAAKGTEATLTVTEYFEEVWIEEGFVAKRPLQ